MRFALSKRLHVPVFYTDVDPVVSFPLWQYKKAKALDKSGLLLDAAGKMVFFQELPSGVYKPPFDLTGKTVLDIGATNGETAWYFKQLGASKVICIECDSERLKCLTVNAERFGFEVYPEPVSVELLSKIKCDYVKCDIEGYEMVLIDFLDQGGKLPPTYLEVHTNWIRDQFLEHDFEVAENRGNMDGSGIGVYMMNNYAQTLKK